MPLTPVRANSFSAGNLTLAWPANYIGWALQSQTNTAGIQTNPSAWFPVPGTQATNQWTIPINTADPAVFYRLFYLINP